MGNVAAKKRLKRMTHQTELDLTAFPSWENQYYSEHDNFHLLKKKVIK
jgi:hypothetical protein